MPTAVIIAAFIAFLAADFFVAREFYKVAAMKGWAEKKYFWLAFLTTFAGYILVAALPDRGRGGVTAIESSDLPEL